MRRTRWLSALESQRGYTAVEMVITMALTALVSGAIFSSFIVLDRVQTDWENRDQARAVGVVAEGPLLRDVQAYRLYSIGLVSDSDNAACSASLILQANSSDAAGPFFVLYAIDPAVNGGSALRRTIAPKCDGLHPISSAIIAHGVISFKITKCSQDPDTKVSTLSVGMSLPAIGSGPNIKPVDVHPPLQLTTRNATTRKVTGCSA